MFAQKFGEDVEFGDGVPTSTLGHDEQLVVLSTLPQRFHRLAHGNASGVQVQRTVAWAAVEILVPTETATPIAKRPEMCAGQALVETEPEPQTS